MVAKTAPAWKAARQRMISTPLRAPAEFGAAHLPPRPLGRPRIRGVIVLTVKPFGETLEAPRTLAVWH
ncbi:hypothetical protein B7P34_35440 [Streptosporangium nondiastaticum]|uniref:Uncharacterized protein n=1 Tax=Streptosporangium nondiastaticum TaxID=35764 RepID=A0A9X7JIF0_9ACTN|nr:hypothetical protein B7P34_35440 [Streptosporangium nondiastaticum]